MENEVKRGKVDVHLTGQLIVARVHTRYELIPQVWKWSNHNRDFT